MGKKIKVGKQRKDKFYHLAKDLGFRSRAAFKLLQLNRKYEFLGKARVCIDLCAAPGGWLQVASQNMPVSSLIIGVDLDPIRPIPNVITFQDDITTDSCRATLKKNLQSQKADIVLNDGAPNVGQNWIQDAYSQVELTLSALKIATQFLVKGGWFITKVFRSKDYYALKFVADKLFKRVIVTKPGASRSESAEIFWLCKHYLAPDKLDPKFLDPAYVFKDLAPKPQHDLKVLLKPSTKKPKAEGYPDDDRTLFHTLSVSDFIFKDNYTELFASANQIIFDDEKIENHPLTTQEIKECCKDLKVLGMKDMKYLTKWRKKLREEFMKKEESAKEADKTAEPDTDEEIEKEQQELANRKLKSQKKKRRELFKLKSQMKQMKNSDMLEEDAELFSLAKIKSKKDLSTILDQAELPQVEEPGSDKEGQVVPRIKFYEKDEMPEYIQEESEAEDSVESDSDAVEESDNDQMESAEESEEDDEDPVHRPLDESDDDANNEEDNPLLEKFDDDIETKTHNWFSQPIFQKRDSDDSDTEEDLNDIELALMSQSLQPSQKGAAKKKPKDSKKAPSSKENIPENKDKKRKDEGNENEAPKPKKIKLSAEELALGAKMIQTKKTKRDILDDAYNRYVTNDDGLPKWFVEDEKKHYRKQLPVTKEEVQEYKRRMRAINARPIKKIAEAKAKKKKRLERKLEKARKKAEALTESADMSTAEKFQNIKAIYKKVKASEDKAKKVTYVVSKKGRPGGRPPGVKGRYKVVDARMKKDKRHLKDNLKKGGKFKGGQKAKTRGRR